MCAAALQVCRRCHPPSPIAPHLEQLASPHTLSPASRSHARPQMLGLQRCVYSASNDKFGGTAVVAAIAPSAAGHQPQRCPLWRLDGECRHASTAYVCGAARDSACRLPLSSPA
jgi:hypothetical protein